MSTQSPVCTKLLYKEPNGVEVRRNKKAFKDLESAITEAKRINNLPTQIHKVKAYKCTKCLKYHIGKGTKIIEKK